jgi:putative endonuclease
MLYTYVLLLANGKYYIGQTNNLTNRVIRHQSGQVRSTKAFRPVTLIHSEQYRSRSESMNREKYLKSLKSRSAIEKIIRSGDGPIV